MLLLLGRRFLPIRNSIFELNELCTDMGNGTLGKHRRNENSSKHSYDSNNPTLITHFFVKTSRLQGNYHIFVKAFTKSKRIYCGWYFQRVEFGVGAVSMHLCYV